MNVLVVYHNNRYPLRASVRDHLFAIRRHGACRSAYLNLATTDVAPNLISVPFDLLVFHTTFLSLRWNPPAFAEIVERCRPLKAMPAVRIGLPQDEFIHTAALVDFIKEFRLSHVFSAAAPSEWPTIYAGIEPATVHFHQVLTGYLEDDTVRQVERFAKLNPRRDIDIGYRAWRAEPWLGRHGLLKTKVADMFAERSPAYDLSVDISTREEDTIFGDDWFRYLLRCKYTIGVEGGSSILDRDGTIRSRTMRYLKEHPGARFEDVERACFPGLDGNLRLFAISPRHLEACATRTCQALVTGAYNGVLRPGEHYIPLEPDFTNIDDVLRIIADDRLRCDMTNRAYDDVVASGLYSQRRLARQILSVLRDDRPRSPAAARRVPASLRRLNARHQQHQALLAFRWKVLARVARVGRSGARRLLPPSLKRLLNKALGRLRV